MQQQIKNPAGGPGFGVGCGGDPNPQQNHEGFSHNCQDIPEPVELLAELYFVHLQRWADAERECRLIVAEILRLERKFAEAQATADSEMAEATRLQRLAHGREVRS
jgi:hypothetical protein